MSYYKSHTTIGDVIELDNGARLEVGISYDKKTKAGKDSGIVLAFHKADDKWIFSGWAEVDFDVYCDEMSIDELQPLAFRSSIIDLQRDLRPGKSSKAAEKLEAKRTDLAELKTRFDNNEIDQDEYISQMQNIALRV